MYITEKGSFVLKYLLNSERPEKIGDISKNMNMSVKSFRSYLKEAEAIAAEYGGSVAKDEIRDMQDYIDNRTGDQVLQYSVDVMHMLTEVRKQWGFKYPFE